MIYGHKAALAGKNFSQLLDFSHSFENDLKQVRKKVRCFVASS